MSEGPTSQPWQDARGHKVPDGGGEVWLAGKQGIVITQPRGKNHYFLEHVHIAQLEGFTTAMSSSKVKF